MESFDFEWSTFGHYTSADQVLMYRCHEVARLVRDVKTREWTAILWAPDGTRIVRECTAFDSGKAGCDAWVERHRCAITAHIDQRVGLLRR